ncbi:MAG TPA: FAD-dependent oxidoreductase [Aestuariivirgaceae bacterium]|nr:FAD-dependent oxidoreductase [Aestuariivirgaceae bacterium]
MNRLTCDICIIGAGSGGLALAAAAARLGRSVVVVERAAMGGECLNAGCVPSKALLAAARHAQACRDGAAFGIAAGEPVADFGRVMDHVRATIAAIAPRDSRERFEGLGCTVLAAEASFTDRDTVVAGPTEIRARRFVVATGSAPAVPAIPGLDGVPYLTNATVFSLDRLPSHLAVVGGGIEGLEMAQAFRRLGARVTVIEAAQPLARHDPELADIVLARLKAEGVVVMAATKLTGLARSAAGVSLTVADGGGSRSIEASHVLFATGRRANVEALALDRAGVVATPDGIRVDDRLRTDNPRIYALGDVIAGGERFTHVAAWQAGIVLRNAVLRLPARLSTDHLPRAMFTDPELAEVGLSEAEARKRGLAPRVARWYFTDSDRAVAERRTEGLVKVVLDAKGRVLGAGIAGLGAGELILPWCDMVARRRRIGAMAGRIAPYPTLSEAGSRIALTNLSALASKRWVHRVLDVMASFG